ncbi:MAG: hypothetical protein AB1742_04485 [bacterium]
MECGRACDEEGAHVCERRACAAGLSAVLGTGRRGRQAREKVSGLECKHRLVSRAPRGSEGGDDSPPACAVFVTADRQSRACLPPACAGGHLPHLSAPARQAQTGQAGG